MSELPADHPLLTRTLRFPFDALAAEHVVPAITQLLEQAKTGLAKIAAPAEVRTYANTLGALETVSETLDWAMSIIAHLESVATTDELRAAYNAVQAPVSAFHAGVALNPGVWQALKAFAATPEAAQLGSTRARLLSTTLDSFRRRGADLADDDKAKLEAIEVELTEVTTKFSQAVVDSSAATEWVFGELEALAGLPESALAAARASAERAGVQGWRLTLQAPSVMPALTYLDDAGLRETIWRAFGRRAAEGDHDNSERLARILQLRREKAQLLGYRDFSDLVLEDRMAHDGARAQAFIADLENRSRAAFEREHEELQAFRCELEGADAPELKPWDLAYYAEKQRRALYDFDEELLRPYFALDSVLSGMFEIVHRLYGIDVRAVSGYPVWHADVQTYGVYQGERLLGTFYADLFPRDDKRAGAWMNYFITGKPDKNGEEGTPHVGLICGNLTEPLDDKPALLTHNEVETVFHEFGHLLHHLLSRVEVASLAGVNVAWDFVELPSQIMENWCWEREALDLFARHHETGAAIPEELFDKMQRARSFRAATAMMRQLGFATVDLELHREFDVGGDESVLERALQITQRFYSATLPNDYAMLCSFTHLFASPTAYAAGYYSYKWAEVLDADAFTAFRDGGIFSREVGTRFRQCILEKGNSADAGQLYRDFMGRDPELQALLDRSGLMAG